MAIDSLARRAVFWKPLPHGAIIGWQANLCAGILSVYFKIGASRLEWSEPEKFDVIVC